MFHANLALIAGSMLSQVKTRIVVVEAANLSAVTATGEATLRTRAIARWLYRRADQIVAVSEGVARDLEQCLKLEAGRVRTIYNPVVTARLLASAEVACTHPWFAETDIPTLLSVGRLEPQKDHATLLRAFAIVRRARPARLVIFGEGSERQRLASLRYELGLDADVDLPGIIDNPYAAMSRASLYVLSSRFEGLPNALIEALACGCPAVSTECPDGPAEILSSQSIGQLVPVAQPEALAAAIIASLDRRWDRKKIAGRGAEFSLERSLGQYLTALDYPSPAVTLSSAA